MHTIHLKHIQLDAEGSHLLVPCTIESQNLEAYAIIDTGASKSVFDSAYLHEHDFIHIQTEDVESSQLTAMVSGTIISIHSLKIEELLCNDFQALAMSLEHVNTIYTRFVTKPIVGLIGGDFLAKYKAVISYKKMIMQLY